MQSTLLRVLQSGEFYPVGSADPKKVDVKIIAATNKNLIEECKKGKFRQLLSGVFSACAKKRRSFFSNLLE